MFDIQFLIQVDGLCDVIGVKLKKLHVEESPQILRHLIASLETRSQAISHRANIWYKCFFTKVWSISDSCLDLGLICQQPTEYCLLNLRIHFLIQKLIIEKARWSDYKELAFWLLVVISCTDRTVQWITNWASAHDREGRLLNIERSAIRVDEIYGLVCFSLSLIHELVKNSTQLSWCLFDTLLLSANSPK